jgi:hypothetical protein
MSGFGQDLTRDCGFCTFFSMGCHPDQLLSSRLAIGIVCIAPTMSDPCPSNRLFEELEEDLAYLNSCNLGPEQSWHDTAKHPGFPAYRSQQVDKYGFQVHSNSMLAGAAGSTCIDAPIWEEPRAHFGPTNHGSSLQHVAVRNLSGLLRNVLLIVSEFSHRMSRPRKI